MAAKAGQAGFWRIMEWRNLIYPYAQGRCRALLRKRASADRGGSASL